MKRSEMIEKIHIILRGCYPQYLDNQSNYSVRIDAEYVLDAIEDAGMLPPSKNYAIKFSNDPIQAMQAIIFNYQWEPEE